MPAFDLLWFPFLHTTICLVVAVTCFPFDELTQGLPVPHNLIRTRSKKCLICQMSKGPTRLASDESSDLCKVVTLAFVSTVLLIVGVLFRHGPDMPSSAYRRGHVSSSLQHKAATDHATSVICCRIAYRMYGMYDWHSINATIRMEHVLDFYHHQRLLTKYDAATANLERPESQ